MPIIYLSWWLTYLPQAPLEVVPEANCPSCDRRANRIWIRDWVRDAIISSETALSPDNHLLIEQIWNQIPSSGILEHLNLHMESCLDVRAPKNSSSCYLRNNTSKE